MKKFSIIICALIFAASAFGQAKKPSIMIMPSDNWCNKNGYMKVENNLGQDVYIPDYQRALVDNADLVQVIAEINSLMADRQFPLKSLEAAMKSVERRRAEMSLVSTRDGASGVMMDPLMELRMRARADIILYITWDVIEQGPKKGVRYTIEAIDAYTDLSIASATSIDSASTMSFSTPVPLMLREAVNASIDPFCAQLQNHFEDLLVNGRTVSINVNVFDNPECINLESVYDGKELREIIEDWMSNNTVEHRYSLADDSELYMNFDAVRIPIYDESGRPIATNQFARGLVGYIREKTGIQLIKLMNQGLGQATIVIGNK